MISKYFGEVFHSQINSLHGMREVEAVLELEIKDKREKITFENDQCKDFSDEISILHKAIYIDNPFVLDELSLYEYHNPMDELLKQLLVGKQEEDAMEGIIETVRAKEKLQDVYETLQSVVNGEIVTNQSTNEYFLKNNDFRKPVLLQNLSTGMKSFVILKMLLEKGALNEKDVLILDEPEIHLHPQWQIVYAELIVLLQKHFDLSVIVTTHSPYFVDALNLFSCKYGMVLEYK